MILLLWFRLMFFDNVYSFQCFHSQVCSDLDLSESGTYEDFHVVKCYEML